MTGSERNGEEHVELATILADDALLDALGRGDPPPDGDDIAALLGSWRAELDADQPTDTGPLPAAHRRAGLRRTLLGAVAAAVLVGGAVLGAQHSGPGDPLWPITRVLYPQSADVRAAEHAIRLAREAVADRRYPDAARLLDAADADARTVTDPATRQRLRDEIDAIRRALPAVAGSTTGTGPTPSVAPEPPGAAPATGPTPAPGTGGAQPPAAGGGGAPPPGLKSLLPQLPAPTLAVPTLPALPLPTLPALPLPTLPGLGGSPLG